MPNEPLMPPAGAGPQITAQIIITLTADGNINIAGSIDQKLQAVGLLELAKKAIFDYHEQAEKRIIAVPPGMQLRKS